LAREARFSKYEKWQLNQINDFGPFLNFVLKLEQQRVSKLVPF